MTGSLKANFNGCCQLSFTLKVSAPLLWAPYHAYHPSKLEGDLMAFICGSGSRDRVFIGMQWITPKVSCPADLGHVVSVIQLQNTHLYLLYNITVCIIKPSSCGIVFFLSSHQQQNVEKRQFISNSWILPNARHTNFTPVDTFTWPKRPITVWCSL